MYFLHPGFVAWLCSLVALFRITVGSCWFFGLLSGTLFSAPSLAAAVGRLLPALRLLPASCGLLQSTVVFVCWLLLGACCWFSDHGLEVLTSSCVWRASFHWHGVRYSLRPFPVLGVVERFLHPGLWRGLVRSPCPVFVFLLVLALCRVFSALCWLPLLDASSGAAALAGLLRLAFVYGRFGVFASSWFWSAFCVFGPLFACRSLLVYLPRSGGIDHILCLVGHFGMEYATRCVLFLCAECRGVFSSSMVLWRGFVRWWPCPGFYRVRSALLRGRWGPGGGLGAWGVWGGGCRVCSVFWVGRVLVLPGS